MMRGRNPAWALRGLIDLLLRIRDTLTLRSRTRLLRCRRYAGLRARRASLDANGRTRNHKLYAPVLRTSRIRGVIGDGITFPISLGAYVGVRNALSY